MKFKKQNKIYSSNNLQDSDQLKKSQLHEKYKINMIGEQDKYQFQGSQIGKLIYYAGIISSVLLFVNILNTMLSRTKDQIKQFTIANDYKEYGDFDMNQKKFMPFLIGYKNRDEINSDDYDIFNSNYPISTDTLTPVYFDPSKLSKYFDFKIIFNENDSYYHQTFKACTKNDFAKNGVDQYKFIHESLCPDTSKFQEQYKVKNDFSYDTFNYLEIAAIPCNNQLRQDCAPDEKLSAIFDDFWFQLYFIDQYVDLQDPNLYEKNPVKTKIKYIQEMQFDRTKYQNHHFSLIHNVVETSDFRFELWKDIKIFEFFSVSLLSGYTSVPYKEVQFSTSDGINFEDIEYELVWLAYITLDTNRVIQKRNVFHILNALGEFGGLQSGLIALFLFFAMDINYNLMTGDFLQNLYFPFQQEENNKYHFNLPDQLQDVWFLKPILCFFKANKKNQFKKLKTMLEEQMNMINMISRIQKLGIMVSTLIAVDEKSIKKAEQIYSNHLQQVQSDSENIDEIFRFIDNFGNQKFMFAKDCQKDEVINNFQNTINDTSDKQYLFTKTTSLDIKKEQEILLTTISKLDDKNIIEDTKQVIEESDLIKSNNYLKLNNQKQGQVIFEYQHIPSHIRDKT